MEIIFNQAKSGNHLSRIDSLITHSQKIILCVGWVKMDGLALLAHSLDTAIQKFANIVFVTNEKHTPTKCVEFLKKRSLRHIIVKEADIYFHTKFYYFSTQENYTAIIGSANITKGALTKNDELSVEFSGKTGDVDHSKINPYLCWLQEKHGV